MAISLAFLAPNLVKAAVEGRLPRGIVRPKASNYGGSNVGIPGAVRSNFALKTRSPGTEFLDAETGRQKSQPKNVNAGRDQNPGSEWPEIPAETSYLASYRKRAVCKDWMVADAVSRNRSPIDIREFFANSGPEQALGGTRSISLRKFASAVRYFVRAKATFLLLRRTGDLGAITGN